MHKSQRHPIKQPNCPDFMRLTAHPCSGRKTHNEGKSGSIHRIPTNDLGRAPTLSAPRKTTTKSLAGIGKQNKTITVSERLKAHRKIRQTAQVCYTRAKPPMNGKRRLLLNFNPSAALRIIFCVGTPLDIHASLTPKAK